MAKRSKSKDLKNPGDLKKASPPGQSASPSAGAGDMPLPTSQDSGRDLRIDFLRGMVMFVLLMVHFEFLSYYNLLVWERVGLISGAEGFVILSGLVIGMVYRQTILRHGWKVASERLLARAAQLYRVNVFVAASVATLSLLPFLDASAVMTFVDRGSNTTYQLFASAQEPLPQRLAKLLTLNSTPHQVQILGLYIVLLVITPLLLLALDTGYTRLLLGISWLLYFYNVVNPSRPTGARFEYAFPLLTWQVLYVHGLAVGYFRSQCAALLGGPSRRPILISATLVFLTCFFLAQNATNPFLPAYAHLSVIPADTFNALYGTWFQKNSLGLGRLLNYTAALIVASVVLTRFWSFFNRAFGWFFIPIGQATLYVFIVHVYLILLLTQFMTFGFKQEDMGRNTLIHTGVLICIWLMVRYKVLFRWIPR